MKRCAGLIVSAVIAVTVLGGCMPRPWIWKSDPAMQSVSNDFFDAQITPVWVTYGTKSFLLTIKNKTEKTIELNWNKTLFISGGQTSGGFMYEGIIFAKRDEPKPNDVVFPKVVFQKEIWPNNLAKLAPGEFIGKVYFEGGWGHWSMNAGVNGVFLTMVVDGKEINEKLTVDLSYIK